MTTTIYGIKNCDTMKKAFKWLDSNNVEYIFHDYKKEGIDEKAFNNAIKQFGWEEVINRRGTTWRQLPEKTKSSMDNQSPVKIARDNPSIVKRPLLIHKEQCLLGFTEESYKDIFT